MELDIKDFEKVDEKTFTRFVNDCELFYKIKEDDFEITTNYCFNYEPCTDEVICCSLFTKKDSKTYYYIQWRFLANYLAKNEFLKSVEDTRKAFAKFSKKGKNNEKENY